MGQAEIYAVGLDVGSTSSKAVVLDGTGAFIADTVVGVGAGTSGPARALSESLSQAGIDISQVSALCATGYGRKTVENATMETSELSCHAKGAARLFPEAHTVIDIGGQDAKVLRLDDRGTLQDFVMNDKCAAGTGRFLDVMARIVELDVSGLAKAAEQATSPAKISSTCTVFAESEVISKLATGVGIADIVAGVHQSVADRVAGLARRLGIKEKVAMTGGVALNSGVVAAMEGLLGTDIMTSSKSQLCGAYGAALFALEQASPERSE